MQSYEILQGCIALLSFHLASRFKSERCISFSLLCYLVWTNSKFWTVVSLWICYNIPVIICLLIDGMSWINRFGLVSFYQLAWTEIVTFNTWDFIVSHEPKLSMCLLCKKKTQNWIWFMLIISKSIECSCF